MTGITDTTTAIPRGSRRRRLRLLLRHDGLVKALPQPDQSRVQQQQIGGGDFVTSQLLRFHGGLVQILRFRQNGVVDIERLLE